MESIQMAFGIVNISSRLLMIVCFIKKFVFGLQNLIEDGIFHSRPNNSSFSTDIIKMKNYQFKPMFLYSNKQYDLSPCIEFD